jgi:hypothetical protein
LNAFNPNLGSLNVGHAVDYRFVVAAFDIERVKGWATTVTVNGFLNWFGNVHDSGIVKSLCYFD